MADEEAPQEAQPAETKAVEKAAPAGKQPALAATAVGPAVVVVPMQPSGFAAPEISRRRVLQVGFWAGLMGLLGALGYATLNIIYPRGVTGFGATIVVGSVDQLKPGSFLRNLDAKAWVMRMGPEQAAREGAPEGSILALYHRCPHLGCTVPYRQEFSFEDPRAGEKYNGWFRCPCHGSTYSFAGVRVFGPAPRSMDTFALTIENGNIIVDTGTISQGTTENPSRAVLPT